MNDWRSNYEGLEERPDLVERQQKIVEKNKELISEPKQWAEVVRAFEAKIGQFPNIETQKSERLRYQIRFDYCEFAASANSFRNLNFPCAVSFRNSKFEGYTSFVDTVFQEDACFNKTKFSEQAQFGGSKFSKHALFHKLETSSLFSMKRAEVGGTLDLSDSKVSRYLELSLAKIGGDLNLERMQLNDASINVSGAKVEGNFNAKADYPERADFSQMQVNGSVTFAGSVFKNVPDFRDAKFDRPTEVAGMLVPKPTLKRKNWSLFGKEKKDAKFENQVDASEDGSIEIRVTTPRRKEWLLFKTATDVEDVSKFRKLKAMALRANDHEKDGEFFAKEMLAKRGWETTSFSGLLFNTLYWQLSDFGQSFVRPLVGMIVSLFFFFLTFRAVILANFGVQSHLENWTETYAAFHLSLRNFIPFFGSLFRFSPRPKEHNSAFMNTYHDLVNKGLDADWLAAIGIIQNIIGAVLLFLFLLALRNKFRLK